jgi:3-methyladenine DNA glycosylase AlkC
MSDSLLIRDFFNPTIINELADKIHSLYSDFDQKGFLFDTLTDLENQTYSERKNCITDALIKYLPEDYGTSVKIILDILPPDYETDVLEATTNRFYITSLSAYISNRGLDHFDLSTQALYKITRCFTSEFDIRLFILKYPDITLALLAKWAKDPNPHVRRLVSEGSRPNLPWGKKLYFVADDPENTTLPLLTLLQDDPSEYVRRSVANHLNDFAKTKADIVVKHLTKWQKKNPTKDKDRMINHALRTLIKNGHKEALALIGYDDDFDLSLQFQNYTKEVPWGGVFEFEFSITNKRATSKNLIVDYIIGFQKKSGKIGDKVFKLKKMEIGGGKSIPVAKKTSFKVISTRVYYAGKQTLAVQVNGVILGRVEFEVLAEK